MKPRTLLAILLLFFGLAMSCLAADPASKAAANGWKLASESGGIQLYSRPRPGSSLKAYKAVGEIDAPIRAVHAVIDDFENYPSFMPYTVECRLVKPPSGGTFFYQRLSPKIVSDRDYTLRMTEKSWRGQGGTVYQHRFEAANEFGPPEKKGITRVNLCEGGWLLEPNGDKTRATYSIDTDSGGKLPAFIANAASEVAIRKLFAAVRKQVKNPKYNTAAP
jgi:hypothetical protein